MHRSATMTNRFALLTVDDIDVGTYFAYPPSFAT